MAQTPLLFTSLPLRNVTLPNRVVIAPMAQYSADNGRVTDWHFAHYARLATGGAGEVFVEATAVEARGRTSHGDLGIWDDAHVHGLQRIADYISAQGSIPAIQIAHAGRKASAQRPWHGFGPIDQSDLARDEAPWRAIGPSAAPVADHWPAPHELSIAEITDLVQRWADGARRALTSNFHILEVHGAHGYLIHSFLSPISNMRGDRYGGDREGRMRLALEITEAVRAVWPDDRPLFFRVSAVDGLNMGWSLDDTVALAKQLKSLGIDVIDCSSGGIGGSATAARIRRKPGFQVPFAERVRRDIEIKSQAVGLITDPFQAEEILQTGCADLIAIARQALYDPFWPRHAAHALGVDPNYETWPRPYGWWLERRDRTAVYYGDEAEIGHDAAE